MAKQNEGAVASAASETVRLPGCGARAQDLTFPLGVPATFRAWPGLTACQGADDGAARHSIAIDSGKFLRRLGPWPDIPHSGAVR